ncbi:MAG: hypothetical protein AAFU53_01830 [Cyanobacteria bacterium J06632_3]
MSSPRSKPVFSSQFRWWQLLGLVAIALFTFHTVSTLVFAVLGLNPASKTWPLVIILACVLSLAGAATGLQQRRFTRQFSTPMAIINGLASGAILGLFIAGQLSDQDTLWATVGLVGGSLLLGTVTAWAYRRPDGKVRRFCRSAIALMGGLCAYAAAFGCSVWAWAALTAGHLLLGLLLVCATGCYLWLTRSALTLLSRHLTA